MELLEFESVRLKFRELFLTVKLVSDHIKAFDRCFKEVGGHLAKRIEN